MAEQTYKRDANGVRIDLAGGMNTTLSPDLIEPGKGYPYLQNVRRLLQGRTIARPLLTDNTLPASLPSGPTSLVRMNDLNQPPIGNGPPSGYMVIIGAAGAMYVNATQVATGFSGNPLSFIPFRPNTSPQPWCYVADSAPAPNVSILRSPAYPFGVTGMVKVRWDQVGVGGPQVRKTGIAEPQVPPTLTPNPGATGPNWVIYRYTYRASETGAVSNPSPECQPQIMAQIATTAPPVIPAAIFATNFTLNNQQYEFDNSGGIPLFRTKGIASGTLTDYVIAKNFSLSVPDGVTIDGVTVKMDWAGQNAGTGVLSNVALYSENAIIGQAKSPGVQNVKYISPTPGAPPYGSYYTAGSISDKWGAGLTPDIVNDPSFGFGVQITAIDSGGSNRSFLYSFTVTVYYTEQHAGVAATVSLDPQVDKIDFYRQGPSLENFTFVGTVPNLAGTPTNAPSNSVIFTDNLSDLDIAANPLLEFDNFEPFPSIDLPRKGRVNVVSLPDGSAVINWASGDPFNIRWLPGTAILIGGSNISDAAIGYTLYNRPSSTTSMIAVTLTTDPITGFPGIGYPPVGTNLTYEIPAPSLAAQPSPVIWGPTPDNAGSFYFGLDELNPGDLLWSKGNNFDSAPDTNRMFVTSPSEPLMNGTITSEISTVFSTERFWLIYPNFADAVATVTGTEGQQWTLTQAAATRGLYMRYAICALGSMIAYRAKDCIAVTMGGGEEKSITDSIYNLFPHGGSVPIPVTIGGNTVYPPDDTKPKAQTISITPSYIFYNYQDTTGTPRTLVYDIEGQGWVVDTYSPMVNCHVWAVDVNQLLIGCTDGTVRRLDTNGSEIGTAIVTTRAENGGDARALKRVGDVLVKAQIGAGTQLSVGLWRSHITMPLTGYAPTTLASAGTPYPFPYIVDFTSGFAKDVDDIAAVLSWPMGSGTILELWQPDWTELPEYVQDRPSDWSDGGTPQNKFYQGFLLECDTFGQPKTFQVESDDGSLHTPEECPFSQNGEAIRSFSFAVPFTAHMVRIISTDEVPWRFGPSGGWSSSWIAQPFPESSATWTAEFSSFGLHGYIHCYQINLAYISSAPVTVTLNTDQGVFTSMFPAGGSGTQPVKVLQKMVRNKWKVCSFSCTSSVPFNVWKDLTEVWLGEWGRTSEYVKTIPFGAQTSAEAPI